MADENLQPTNTTNLNVTFTTEVAAEVEVTIETVAPEFQPSIDAANAAAERAEAAADSADETLSSSVKKNEIKRETPPNLFNKSGITEAASIHLTTFVINTGVDPGFAISNKITAIAGHRYFFKGRTSQYAIRFENSSGGLISGVSITAGNAPNDLYVDAPEGCVAFYFGVRRPGDNQNLDNIVVNDITAQNILSIENSPITASKVLTGAKDQSGNTLATLLDIQSARSYTDQQVIANKTNLTLEQVPITNLFNIAGVEQNASIGTTGFQISRGQPDGFSISNRIPAIPGHRYRIRNRTSRYAVRFEDSSNTLIPNSGIVVADSNASDYTVTAPANCTGFYFGSSRAGDNQNLNNITVQDLDAVIIQNVEKINSHDVTAAKVIDGVKNKSGQALATEQYVNANSSNNFIPSNYAESYLGNVLVDLKFSDICSFIFYGQSLSVGEDSNQNLTIQSILGNYMLGTNVGSVNSNVMNPLVASLGIEQPIVALTNVFSELYRKEVGQKDFLALSAGVGGQVIDALSKASLSGTAFYNDKFIAQLNNSKSSANTANKTISCPAIFFLQGESDYGTKLHSVAQDASSFADRVALYKSRLIQLKNDMQADVISTYGQSRKPLFFVHNPQGSWAASNELFVHVAQIQACDENEDMILLGSPYFATKFKTEHLSSNGYRWDGEMIAKSAYKTLIKGIRFEPLRPKKFTIKKNKIFIDFFVPVPPIRIDTYTVKASPSFGFNVMVNGSFTSVVSVEVYSGTCICLTLNENLEESNSVLVRYSSRDSANLTVGTGNLCDSDRWSSMYTYANDNSEVGKNTGDAIAYRPLDKSGNSILGKKYPMQNWCILFAEKIK